MKKPTESDLVRQVLDLLRLHGILAWRSNNTGIFDPSRKVFRTFHGLKGVSDVLAVVSGGRLLAIETKSPTGRVSPAQAAFLASVEAAGGVSAVVRDLRDLEAILDGLKA